MQAVGNDAGRQCRYEQLDRPERVMSSLSESKSGINRAPYLHPTNVLLIHAVGLRLEEALCEASICKITST